MAAPGTSGPPAHRVPGCLLGRAANVAGEDPLAGGEDDSGQGEEFIFIIIKGNLCLNN